MIILGIESSCDDTACALIDENNHVLSSLVASQIDVHKEFGGVVPEIAARKHLSSIYPLFQKTLAQASIEAKDIDLIAVTQGPGLVGALLIGVSFARGLAATLNKPLQPVDHVYAHVHGALLERQDVAPLFPALAVVVSGGHTNLYYMEHPTSFKLIGYSIDDACGECFDKVAKVLGMDYPGGVYIEEKAKQGDPSLIPMPRLMAKKDSLQFSYSGLKTHMVYYLQKHPDLSEQHLKDLCAAFQDEAFRQIVDKTSYAAATYKNQLRSVIVAGGVSANLRFRHLLSRAVDVPVVFPNLQFCSDNGAMIAALGRWMHLATGKEEGQNPTDWDIYANQQGRKT